MRGKKIEKQKEKKLILSRHPKNGFGFSIRGGKEHGTRIYISGVNTYAKAYQQGLTVGDVIVKANRKVFHDLSHTEAVEFIRAQRQLHLVVISSGILPDRKLAYTEYQWIDCYGEACSPLRPSSQREGNKINNNNPHGRRDNMRKVNVVVGADKKLGLLIRGGSEYGLGIFVAGIDENSVADRSGIMVGEQIIELNGIDFLSISQKDAAYLIQNSKMMTFLLKDVSKIPVSKIVHEHIQWIDKRDTRSLSAAGSSKKLQNTVFKPGIAGSQIQHQAAVGPTSYSFLEEKANHSLNQDEWLTLKYYIREYIHGDVTVNGFALSLMDLLDTDEKMQLLTEVRSIVKAHDLDTFDTIVLGQEVEAIKIENQYSLQTLSDESLSAENIEKTAIHTNEVMHGIHPYENGNIEHENEQYEKEELEERLLFQSFDESVQEELKSLREEEAHQEEYSSKLISRPQKERAAPPQMHEKGSYVQHSSVELIPEKTQHNIVDFTEKSQYEKNMNNRYNDKFISNHDIRDNGNYTADGNEEKKDRSIKSSEITALNKEITISNPYREKIKRQQRFDTDSNSVGKNFQFFNNEIRSENRTNGHLYNNQIENVYKTIEIEGNANEENSLEETICQSYDYSDGAISDSKIETFNQDNQSKPLKLASLQQRLEVKENLNPYCKSIENSDYWSSDISPSSSKNPNDFYSYYHRKPSGPSLSDFQPRYYKSMNLPRDKTDFTNEKSSETLPIVTNESQPIKSIYKKTAEKSNKFEISSGNETNISPTFDVTSTLEARYAQFSVNDILRQDYLPNSRADSGNLHFSLNETSSDEFESKNKKPHSFKLNIRNQYQYENSENYRNLKPISTQDSVISDRFKMYGKPIMSKSPRYDSPGAVLSAVEMDSYKKLVTLKNPLKKASELNDTKTISNVESIFLNNDLDKLTDFDLRAKELPQSSTKNGGSKERAISVLSESKTSKVGSILKSNHNKVPNVVKKGSFLIGSDDNFVTESILSKIEAFSDRNTQKSVQTKLTKKGNQKQYKTKNVLIPNDTENPGFTVSTKHNEKDVFISSIENKNLKDISVGDIITAIDDKPIAIGIKVALVNLMIKNAFKSSNPHVKLTIKC